MDKKQIIIVGAAVVIVAAVVIAGVLSKGGGAAPGGAGVPTGLGGAAVGALEATGYVPEVPKGVVETKVENEILVQSPAGELRGRVGTYAITATRSGYEPSQLVVKLGDAVTIELAAEGGTFDMYSESAGFYTSASEGGKGTVSFTASMPGTFLFKCRDYCPAGGKIQGTLVIKPGE
ncbi:MAG: hypothetical protein V1696_01985 [Candidatus Jorgensenbacteria bacterium]